MSCAPGYRTCEPGRRPSAGNSTLSMRRPPISTPTSNSPTTWKDSSPGSIPTPPPPRCRTASGSCGCSSRTSSSNPKRSPSALPSQQVPAPAGTTPNPTRRVTMAPVIHCVGGVLSPLLANIVLSVLDEDLHRPWRSGGAMSTRSQRERRRAKGLPNWRIVRYADDFAVLGDGNQADVEALREQISGVLTTMGLAFSEAKTRVVHMSEGFDFLGFHIQWKRKRG